MNESDENGSFFRIRPGTVDDCEELLKMFHELASVVRLDNKVDRTVESLKADGFGPTPYFRCLVVEPISITTQGGAPSLLGFALFCNKYSACGGRVIYLEDIYVSSACRKRGVGRALFKSLSKIAVDEGCARIEFLVMSWNKDAIKFYKRVNACDVTERDDLHFWRMEMDGIKRLADS